MIRYIATGTYLFRFMDHRSPYFSSNLTAMLSESKLFLNSRANFNDPFDSQPAVTDDLQSSAIRKYLKHMMADPFNGMRSPSAVFKILELREAGKTHLNKRQIENIKLGSRRNAFEYLDTCGLLSFSRIVENPLLWGHYAASFSGICVVFRRASSMTSGFSVCAEINYVERRPELPLSLLFEMGTSRMMGQSFDELATKVLCLSFLHKDRHWAYEQEARIFYPFDALKKIPFDPRELVGIILGPKSSAELCEHVRSEVKEKRPALDVQQASLSPKEFKIIIPPQYTSNKIAA